MRRVPHGGTTHSIAARPGNGYGRPVRPGPDPARTVRFLVLEADPRDRTRAAIDLLDLLEPIRPLGPDPLDPGGVGTDEYRT